MKKTILVGSLLFALPLVAGAQQANLEYFSRLLNNLGGLVNGAIPLLIGIALLIFFWGLVKYIQKPGGGGEHGGTDGKKIMIAGLVGLFIMVSVWGIIRVAQTVLGVQSGTQGIQSPSIPPR